MSERRSISIRRLAGCSPGTGTGRQPLVSNVATRSSIMRSLLVVVVFAPTLLAAQNNPASADSARAYGHQTAVPSAVAARRVGPIVLDAKLDEAAWQAATPVTKFLQTDPDEGQPASQRTEVRFLYD